MIRIFKHLNGLEQRLAVTDLLDGDDIILTMAGSRRVGLVYCDPPWSPGNEKWWRRHAKVSPSENYQHLLDSWCRVVSGLVPSHVIVEQSINSSHHNMLLTAIEQCEDWRLPLIQQWTATYGSPKRPYKVFHFGPSDILVNVTGMHGVATTQAIFDAMPNLKGSVVADPCTGFGMSSRMAYRVGAHFIGTELAPHRLARAANWVLAHGYEEIF